MAKILGISWKVAQGVKKEKMTMIQLFNRLIIMDVSNWETNCHIKWQFWFGFCRFVILYSIYCAYWRVQVRSYKYYTSKWHFQNIRWEKKRLLKSKLRLKNGWPSKPAFWSAFWHKSWTNRHNQIMKKTPERVGFGIYSCQISAFGLK